MKQPAKDRTCHACGAKTVAYPETLTGAKVGILRIILGSCDQLGHFEVARCSLNRNQAANMNKLKYWGIIEKQGDPTGKGGRWRVTAKGLAFAEGMRSLPRKCWTYRGKLIEYEADEVYVEDVSGGWKYRPDYARGSRPFLDAPEQSALSL